MTLRIAMWSGPRNLSTALMRAFENRPDTTVVDEPFYACYLEATGLEHPGRDAILASQPRRWGEVQRALLTEETGSAVQYQKHMTQHLLADVGLDFLASLRNAFLIRDPARIIASYLRVRPLEDFAELGLDRQFELYRYCCHQLGSPPPVVDAAALQEDPGAILAALCAALELPFDEAMLAWPPGRRDSGGVWGPWWYEQVWASTGFAPPDRPEIPEVPARYRADLARVRAYYEEMLANAVGVAAV